MTTLRTNLNGLFTRASCRTSWTSGNGTYARCVLRVDVEVEVDRQRS
jgi:hypothetical protein